MAKISAHGKVIGTVEYIAKTKRFMSDGTVLINQGFGWKVYGRCKPSLSINEVYEKARDSLDVKLATYPCTAEYRKGLHSLVGIGKRWKLHTAISLMPDDCDGVWSECCDGYGDNVHADVDEIANLCRLYNAALAEKESKCGTAKAA